MGLASCMHQAGTLADMMRPQVSAIACSHLVFLLTACLPCWGCSVDASMLGVKGVAATSHSHRKLLACRHCLLPMQP